MAWDQQSPVNLRPMFRCRAPDNYLRVSWAKAIDGFRHAGAHGVEILFGVTPDKYIELGGKQFHLRQFHFHHPSEHLLDGRTFDAEVHIVHQNLDDLSFAVVGIFLAIDELAKDDETWAAIIQAFRKAHERSSPIPLEPLWWLPPRQNRVFRYEGSLTTEPYTESVSWIVFPTPKKISPDLFSAVFGSHPQSARPIQAHNRRFILDLGVKVVFVT